MSYLDAPTLSPNEVEVFARQIIEARARKVSLGTVANQTKVQLPAAQCGGPRAHPEVHQASTDHG